MAGGEPPKRRSTHRRTHTRRSHALTKLASAVNARSPVKVVLGRRKLAAKK